jgi:hypothetical protein
LSKPKPPLNAAAAQANYADVILASKPIKQSLPLINSSAIAA